MVANHAVYRQLQRHLDNQAVGYPKTLSGAEINLLKHFFSREEAEIALSMDYKFRPINKILEKIDINSLPEDEVREKLSSLVQKGGIAYRKRDGQDTYALIPLIVGMFEGCLEHLSGNILKDFRKYTNSLPYGISFLATEVPQMRTIPVGESINSSQTISSFDEISNLLEKAPGPFVTFECICRKAKKIEGESCKVTERTDTCMALNQHAFAVLKMGIGKELSKKEAIELIKENANEGLILQPSNTQDLDFICSCCGCCCGMLEMHQKLPNPAALWATNFHSILDGQTCTGCGLCEKKCQVDAIKLVKRDKNKNLYKVNHKKCLGCGVCVVSCKFDAIHLRKKENEKTPPENHDDLYDTIMKNKKEKWGRLKQATKIMLGMEP